MPASPQPSVVVSGWAGSTNLGDELLSVALVRKLTERGVDPLVISTDAAVTEANTGSRALDHRALPAVAGAVRRADGLLLGPGGLLQDATSHLNLPNHLSRPWLARLAGTPFSGIGLGVGPLRTGPGRAMVRRTLRRARRLGVRDHGSADLLRSLGLEHVVVGADLALSLSAPQVTPTDHAIVSLRPPVPGGLRPVASRAQRLDSEWVAAAAAALDGVAASTGLAIRFVPMQTDRDDALHRAIGARMTADHSHASPTVTTVLDDLAAGKLVIAMRYHAAIGALMGARPAVLLGYDPKVDALAAEVGDGFAGIAADLGALATIVRKVENVLGSGTALEAAFDRLRERERAGDAVLDDLLEAAG